jgi:hypothetical protein
MGLGWHNALPFQVGGGPTQSESAYEAMKKAVGEGGYAKNEEGIDGLWRAARAQSIASLNLGDEIAAVQAFPNLATAHLGYYEWLFYITPPEGATLEERQRVVAERYTAEIQASIPEIDQQLKVIDQRAEVLGIVRATSTIVQLGKAFEPQDGLPDYGVRTATSWPNFAGDFVLTVLLDLGHLVATPAELLIIERIKRFLPTVLQGWMTFQVCTSVGFVANLSPIDVTAIE